MEKTRLFYLDLVRAMAMIFIVIAHFNYPFLNDHPIFPIYPLGVFLGDLGVSLFLIVSGTALMYTNGDSQHLNLASFFWKRFKSIYPMFWIAFIVSNCYLAFRSGGASLHRAPGWTLLLSVLGLDGYISITGLSTFYTLGEWFLGFIIIFYLIFPILRIGVKNYPLITFLIATPLYIASNLFHIHMGKLPGNLLLTTRLPELLFGMYFAKYVHAVPLPITVLSFAFLLVQQATNVIPSNWTVAPAGIAIFLILYWVSQKLTNNVVRQIIYILSKYSYAVFLTHHMVIIFMFEQVGANNVSGKINLSLLLLIVDALLIAVLSYLLFVANKNIQKQCGRVLQRVMNTHSCKRSS